MLINQYYPNIIPILTSILTQYQPNLSPYQPPNPWSQARLHKAPLLRVRRSVAASCAPLGLRPRHATEGHGHAAVAAAGLAPGNAVAEVVPGEAVEHVPAHVVHPGVWVEVGGSYRYSW